MYLNFQGRRFVAAYLVFICLLLVAQVNHAQDLPRIEIPSSFNPVGSGARALGMGGAFIAVADDATAASWNPGGLIQLETPEFSVVGAWFERTEDNTFGTNPEADGSQDVDVGNINYLSAAYPFMALNRNMIISVNYQLLYDLTRHWKFPLGFSESNLTIDSDIEIDQEGSLAAVGIAYGIQISPRVSFGFTLNIWKNGPYNNSWTSEYTLTGPGTYLSNDVTFDIQDTDEYEFSGTNANLGMLWHATDQITLGFVLKTPFTAELAHKSTKNRSIFDSNNPNNPPISTVDESNEYDEELDMPMSYGVGVAYRSSDKLTISMDLYRTAWDEFILTDTDGDEISPITSESADESNTQPTSQVRAGLEYLFIQDDYIFPFRAGVFYDPAPTDGKPDDIYGFSLGSGITRGRLIFDMAYQFRWGNNISDYILEEFNYSQDLQEHTIYTSLIYHF
jgi:long-subunit fatty acid transport protein